MVMEKSAERLELKWHYDREIRQAIRNPGKTIVCHQRYTIRERIAKILGVKFAPTHRQLAVTFYGLHMGFLWTSAS